MEALKCLYCQRLLDETTIRIKGELPTCNLCKLMCKFCGFEAGGHKLEIVGSDYLCMNCGRLDTRRVETTVRQGAVAYKEIGNYTIQSGDTVTAERRGPYIHSLNTLIENIHDLTLIEEAMRVQLQKCTMKIIDRCLLHSQTIRRKTPYNERPERFVLPRNRDLLTVAALLIALDNMRQFCGKKIHVLQTLNKEDADRVTSLKCRIETSSLLNIFDGNVIRMATCKEKLEMMFITLCNEINIPHKAVLALSKRFDEIIRSVMMNGKNNNHLAAAVIVHCLGECEKFETKIDLTETQLDLLCSRVSLRKKALLTHIKQLTVACCGHADAPPSSSSTTETTLPLISSSPAAPPSSLSSSMDESSPSEP